MLVAIELTSCSTVAPMSVRGTTPERWRGVRGKVKAVGRLLAVPQPEAMASSSDGAQAGEANVGV